MCYRGLDLHHNFSWGPGLPNSKLEFLSVIQNISLPHPLELKKKKKNFLIFFKLAKYPLP